MASGGAVLYQRGQNDSDSDLWDDTALIKAYDNAINLMKDKMLTPDEDKAQKSPQNLEKKKKNKSRNRNRKKKWKVGDLCRAVYTEDGLIYDAEIISLDEDAGTCLVNFLSYGNEETQNLADLLNPTSSTKTMKRMLTVETSSVDMKTSNQNSRKNSAQHNEGWGFPSGNQFQPNLFPSFSNMSNIPQFSSSVLYFSFFCYQNMPSFPPPPPLMDIEDGDNEALCSMLMSWYMSGYHTGYYQGLKQGRLQSGSQRPR
ncbi:hypothetical protein ScPMuIL_018497 [Solemya velum]